MYNTEEQDNGFTINYANSGDRLGLCAVGENTLVFILRGKIRTIGQDKDEIILSEGHMYNMSRELTFRVGYAMEDTLFLCVKSDETVPYVDFDAMQAIKKSYKPIEFYEVQITSMMRHFLDSIILLKEEGIHTRAIYEIKKQEFVFLMRHTLSKDDLSKLLAAAINAKNEFRLLVYSRYQNSISAKELAEKCFMTPKTFTKHFKEAFDTTPYQWILEKKINNLRTDLFYKNYPINAMLREYGFGSESELKKFFKRNDLEELIKLVNQKQ